MMLLWSKNNIYCCCCQCR